ncbi:MAG: hypothetical protein QM788_10555 [Roseateles sp.]|uniref:hypothetical protein n=1 Tax=Roseateles sp. TaxID=1971397 RepID=UPI0039ECC909
MPPPRPHPLRIAALAVLGLAGAGARADAMVIHHGPLAGLTASGVPDADLSRRTAYWAAQAGLALRWVDVPLKRSLEELRRNEQPFCVLGAFDLPERRRYARFSLPLAAGEGQVLLAARRVAAQMRALPDVRSALLDPRFELLAFDGVAYGTTLDRWIGERTRKPLWVGTGMARLAPMLARGRADFTISVPSALQELRATDGAEAAEIEALVLPGMPPPPTRHLACSLSVPAAWLARFDAAVRRGPPR